MNRRTYLRGLAAGSAAPAVAGCLGGSKAETSPNTYLAKPASQRADSADLPYPAWSQKLPSVTLPDPLTGEPVSTTQFEGQRNVMLTLFYSHCPNVCQQMVGQMRNVQAAAIENGDADEVEFLAITFDPARDTASRLRTYVDEKNISLQAGDWHFMRPPTEQRVTEVTDQFGMDPRKKYTDTGTASSANGTNATANGTATPANDASGNASAGGGASNSYVFVHGAIVLLANVDGYVERAYQFAKSGNAPWQDRRDDLEKLIDKEQ
ncbi:MAG: SCO family protein [Haloarculaceae archaeon]